MWINNEEQLGASAAASLDDTAIREKERKRIRLCSQRFRAAAACGERWCYGGHYCVSTFQWLA